MSDRDFHSMRFTALRIKQDAEQAYKLASLGESLCKFLEKANLGEADHFVVVEATNIIGRRAAETIDTLGK
jgi:hypothetical protein